MAVNAETMSRPVNQGQRDNTDHVHEGEGKHREEDGLGRRLTADTNVIYGVRVHGAYQLPINLFIKQQCPHHFDATPGRTSASDKTGQKQHPQWRKNGPQRIVNAGKTGGRRNGHQIESNMAHRRVEIRINPVFPDVHGDHHDAQQGDAKEPYGLRIVAVRLQRTSADGEKERAKIHAGNQHEDDGDSLDGRGVEVTKTGIVG